MPCRCSFTAFLYAAAESVQTTCFLLMVFFMKGSTSSNDSGGGGPPDMASNIGPAKDKRKNWLCMGRDGYKAEAKDWCPAHKDPPVAGLCVASLCFAFLCLALICVAWICGALLCLALLCLALLNLFCFA